MFWPCLICAYVFTSLLLGLMFHLAAWFDGQSSPTKAELVMFFAVFSLVGIPLVLTRLFFTAFTSNEGLVSKEI